MAARLAGKPAHHPGYYDVALRDLGLLVAALALGRLAQVRATAAAGAR